jgi:hypothetical protein
MADRHQDKDIQAAIEYALNRGWRLFVGGSHAWGFLYCPHEDRDGCRISIWSTPRSPRDIADRIIRRVDRCPHTQGGRG